MQDAALVAMRSEVITEVTKLRSRELQQAQQELRQQLQQQVHSSFPTMQQSHIQTSHTMLTAALSMFMPQTGVNRIAPAAQNRFCLQLVPAFMCAVQPNSQVCCPKCCCSIIPGFQNNFLRKISLRSWHCVQHLSQSEHLPESGALLL